MIQLSQDYTLIFVHGDPPDSKGWIGDEHGNLLQGCLPRIRYARKIAIERGLVEQNGITLTKLGKAMMKLTE
jgi:hypothetical protein